MPIRAMCRVVTMSVRNLDKILRPRRIALVGGCERDDDLGICVLRNLLGAGFPGVVYPVHPTREAILGVAAYPSLAGLPRTPDLAIVCTAAAGVAEVVRDCGNAGIRGVLIISGGFRESGEAGQALEDDIAAAAAPFDGMRIIGPNSLGVIHPSLGLNASHAVTLPKPGHLAFISESRALCNSVIDWATEEGIGFSSFVSTGNRLDVGFGDLIDYFGNDPETRAIILYVQSIEHARRFVSAARAFALTKPIVAYKAGRFAASATAVLSHTGFLVGEDAVYDAAFQRCGIVRVKELDDVFDVAEVLASKRVPQGARLAIISNAGGPAIIAADALLARGGQMAQLGDDTVAALEDILPPVGSHQNPVDLLDGAPPARFGDAAAAVLQDPGVDALLVIFATQTGSDPERTAQAVVTAAGDSRKPVLATWMGGRRVLEGVRLLNQAGLPTHATPEQGVRAFMHLVSYARNLQELYETPREMPLHFALNRRKLRRRIRGLFDGRHVPVTEHQAKGLLKAYEIDVCETCLASTTGEAVRIAERIGYPVVLKVLSPQILHRVEAGGVALSLRSPAEVIGAFDSIVAAVTGHRPDAQIRGISVQKMVEAAQGVELIVGAKKDPTFGSVIMVGMGGSATRVVQQRAVALPPLNERLVRRMLESLPFWPLMQARGVQRGLAVDALTEAIIRFSLMIADYPEIEEFDINPLLVTPDGVVALDAVMIVDGEAEHPYHGQHPHLAIRPYPEDYVRHARLRDGAEIRLRSVRAEDEPLWHALVARSSAESIRFRFRCMFGRTTHQMAVEHCFIDHERQIGIVAELQTDDGRELVGVAQLVADPNHESAEFAVLVPDIWQGLGIGGTLLDYCLELARGWGIQRVTAETEPRNQRMLGLFRRHGFRADIHLDDDVVLLERDILPLAPPVPAPFPATTGVGAPR